MFNATAESVPRGYALLGGLPSSSVDRKISLAFLILFSLLWAVMLIRVFCTSRFSWSGPQHATLFFSIAHGLRLTHTQSGSFNESRIVAEQVMFVLGFYFVACQVSDLVDLDLKMLPNPSPSLVNIGAAVFDILVFNPNTWLLIGALILGSVSSAVLLRTEMSDVLASSLIRCRKASAIIFLFLSVMYVICALWGSVQNPYGPARGTGLLLIMSGLLLTAASYQMALYQLEAPPVILSSHGKAIFATIWQLPLWIASALLMSFDLTSIVATKEMQEAASNKPLTWSWSWKWTWSSTSKVKKAEGSHV